MSMERYRAIKLPTSIKHNHRIYRPVGSLLLIWILAGVLAAPLLYIRKVSMVQFSCLNIDFSHCIEDWPYESSRQGYSIIAMIVVYVIPLGIVVVCYALIGRTLWSDESQQNLQYENAAVSLARKKVARMLVVLIVAFVICWLPYNILSLKVDLTPNHRESNILPFALWLGYAHSALNPLLYWLLDKNFRHCTRDSFKCHESWNTEHPQL